MSWFLPSWFNLGQTDVNVTNVLCPEITIELDALRVSLAIDTGGNIVSCESIDLKQGEQKDLVFTIRNSNEDLVDLTGSTYSFEVEDFPGTPLFTVPDGDFDKTDEANGVVRCPISSTNSNQTPRTYVSELRINLPGGDIDKSVDIDFTVRRAVT